MERGFAQAGKAAAPALPDWNRLLAPAQLAEMAADLCDIASQHDQLNLISILPKDRRRIRIRRLDRGPVAGDK